MLHIEAGVAVMNKLIPIHHVKRMSIVVMDFVAGCYIQEHERQCSKCAATKYVQVNAAKWRNAGIIADTSGEFVIVEPAAQHTSNTF